MAMATLNAVQKEKKLDLSEKKLKKIKWQDLACSNDLSSLDLQRNKLKDLKGISSLRNLRELNLSRNELSNFPLEVQELHSLERLYLSQNNIRSVPNGILSHLNKLQFLKLSTNRLTELPSDMGECKNLSYLNLSNNRLRDLQALLGLTELQELFVENNSLVELPAELFLNTGLRKFKASGNQLKKPPVEVCAGGVRNIQHYFQRLRDGSLTTSRVKTMFLGSSMAGKSTLCRSLREGRPVEVDTDDRTVGIEINELKQAGVCFLLWDFAGHEEYYFTHHVFITPYAFVILAIDLSRYNDSNTQSFIDNVSFWIKNIQLKVPDAVVLPVGTHVDNCESAEEVKAKKEDIERRIDDMLTESKDALNCRKNYIMNEKDRELYADQLKSLVQLAKHNLTVLELITIDCTKPEEIIKLKDHILQKVQNKDTFPFIERTLPDIYQEVESAVQSLIEEEMIPQHGMVSLDELLSELNHKVDELNEEDLKFILEYLHLTGIVVWYKAIPELENTVFVKPSFLITLFKTIVRHDLVKQLEGIPRHLLQQEKCRMKDRSEWIDGFKGKAAVKNVAIRALLRQSLAASGWADDDFVEEIVGTAAKDGTFLRLLKYFEVCLPTAICSPLNPRAPEFNPAAPSNWSSENSVRSDADSACLFPSFLQDSVVVRRMWGEDSHDDIRVHIYLLPEIPHGFFHRLIIKTCSLYSTHWMGKDCCVVGYNKKLVLFGEKHRDGDQYIEIRCRMPDINQVQQSWDVILTVMRKLSQLSEQWPGLCQIVCSPCREIGCSADFRWRDWQDLKNSDIFNVVKEKKLICQNGHTRLTALLFPKVSSGNE